MHAFLYVTLPAICLLLVFALGELVVRKPRRQNVWLAITFIAFALVLLRAFLLFSGWMSAVPFLYESTLAANFWIGPLSYFYIRAAVGLENEFASPAGGIRGAPNEYPDAGAGESMNTDAGRREPSNRATFSNWTRLWPHFLPGLLAWMLVVPNMLQPAATTTSRITLAMQFFDGATDALLRDLYMLLTPLALVHVAIYLGLLIRSMLLVLNLETLRRQETARAFLVMTAMSLISTACAFTGILFAIRALVEFAIGLLALVVPLMYLFQKRYPDLFEILEGLLRAEREKRARYAQSQLAGVDLKKLERRLRELMDTERVYRREDLTLPALATLLETTPHRLSEYLNKIQQISFSDFVNRHRVQAARELLLERRDETVLAIAYEVGFNSKSAFNKAFVRFAGSSPTRFRKRARRSKD